MREDCDRFHVAALLRPDGELSPLELRFLQAHAAHCRGCRAYAAQIGRITACIRATPPLRLERRVVVRRRSARESLVRLTAAVGIGVAIASGVAATKHSASTAPQVPSVAGTAGVRKAI